MTQKEKAKELVDKHYKLISKSDECLHIDGCPNVISCQLSEYACDGWLKYAKQSALIGVDEIIEAIRYRTLYTLGEELTEEVYVPYWQEVKQEIEKL